MVEIIKKEIRAIFKIIKNCIFAPKSESIYFSKNQLYQRKHNGNPKGLIILVHGWCCNESAWDNFVTFAEKDEKFEGWDFYAFKYKAGFFSGFRLDAVGKILSTEIGTQVTEKNYRKLLIVGHSIGALIVRSAYLHGLKISGTDSLPSWTGTNSKTSQTIIDRLVLLAPLNRGTSYPERRFFVRWFLIPISRALGVFLGQPNLIEDALKGSIFITNLRLEWITEFGYGQRHHPPIVQTRGAHDTVVIEDDSNDMVCFSQKVREILVDATGHNDLVKFKSNQGPAYTTLCQALFANLGTLPELQSPQLSKTIPPAVVMMVHGIRTYGDWMEKLGNIKELKDSKFRLVKAGYGYFCILDFMLSWRRRDQIRFFCDKYTENLAQVKYAQRMSRKEEEISDYSLPNVPFHFVGHSYGTFIFASSLKKFKRMKFDYAYLAGSVLPRDFDWYGLSSLPLIPSQVRKIRNDLATNDWPVGFLCAGLQGLGAKDLGTAGYLGFQYSQNDTLIEANSFPGGHSMAVSKPENLKSIAKFLLTGDVEGSTPAPISIYLLPFVYLIGKPFNWVMSLILGILSKVASLLIPIIVFSYITLLACLLYTLWDWEWYEMLIKIVLLGVLAPLVFLSRW